MLFTKFDNYVKEIDMYYIENSDVIDVYSGLQSDGHVQFKMKKENDDTFTLYYRDVITKNISDGDQLRDALVKCKNSYNIFHDFYYFIIRYGRRASSGLLYIIIISYVIIRFNNYIAQKFK